jgi:hypothetical protein
MRFLIERMCETYGPSSKVTCVLSTDSPLGGQVGGQAGLDGFARLSGHGPHGWGAQ